MGGIRVNGTRWLVGFIAVLGLLGMHGLTASTVSAAGCGAMPAQVESHGPHAHEAHGAHGARDAHAVPATDLEPDPVAVMGMAPLGGTDGSLAMICVAILLIGIVLGLTATASRRMHPVRVGQHRLGRPSTGTRAPPERADLSVWRN